MCYVYFVLIIFLGACLIVSLHVGGFRDSKTTTRLFRLVPRSIRGFLSWEIFAADSNDPTIGEGPRMAGKIGGIFGIVLFTPFLALMVVLLIACLAS